MSKDVFSCVLMNPGDVSSYQAAVKNALLYADKVYTLPILDVVAKMGAEAYRALDDLTDLAIKKIQPAIIKQHQRFQSMRNKSSRAQKKVKERINHSFRSMIKSDGLIQSNWQAQGERILEVNRPNLELAQQLEKELEPAIRAGYVIIKDLKDNENLIELMANPLALPFAELIPRTFAALAGKELPKRDIELTTIYLWASEAAVMTSTLDCPLMTGLPWFMEFLNGRTCLSLVSRWLEEHRAGQEWRCSFSLCFVWEMRGFFRLA